MRPDDSKFATVPVGKLGIIVHPSCAELGKRIDQYIVNWRKEREHEHKENVVFKDYEQDTYIIDATCSRFGTGEAKALISDSVRAVDLYILADVLNYSLKYKVCGHENHMSPDDIYADVKRIIGAASGKPKSITVIMPFLYESRQHKRSSRESLDCAYALQELTAIGVDNVLTFDAHDPRVQNAIPLKGFDNIMPTYQFIKALLRSTSDLDEFLGSSVEGKDVMIIDDMISSGESMLDVARELKRRKARRVFCISTFGMFTNGLESFDKAYEEGLIYKVITTNCTYQRPDLFERPWYVSCDVAKYIALLIDSINHEASISAILNPHDRITKRLEEYKQFHTIKEEK